MIMQRFAGLSQRSVCVVTLALCLCVIVQMLGAPVTLLSAEDVPDEFSGSVLEGLSIPQTHPPLALSSESLPAVDSLPSVRLLVLASEQFHPPAL